MREKGGGRRRKEKVHELGGRAGSITLHSTLDGGVVGERW